MSFLTRKVIEQSLDDHYLVGRFGENSFLDQKVLNEMLLFKFILQHGDVFTLKIILISLC